MADWIAAHRQVFYLMVATSAVLLPLLIGAALRQVPMRIFSIWALPLAGGTLLLVLGIQLFESTENPLLRLGLNLLFGLFWIAGGITTAFLKAPKTGDVPAAAQRTAKMIGTMFLLFGLIWIGISLFQFFT